ncbi:hypothetical protein BDV96DRAFT_647990 [Lophiotrema nucula]|uniref:Heterokaryon incompatibility protein-domain-containing protein n=1 Tax=Lophiotrema nucula TaxID=690887 RepID=A0A6A5Z3V2_9PLEO|nr:hypothetical protein BDV96DRAFT_647990 [Lophiotrema nucula]
MKMNWLTEKLTSTFPTELIGVQRRTLTSDGHTSKALLYLADVLDSKTTRIDATLPEDRVFALLGLANDATAQEIVANYTISCEAAYTRAARILLNHGHDDMLSLCRKRDLCKDLPSWVPDWSAENRKPWSIWDQERLFNASASTSVEIMDELSAVFGHQNIDDKLDYAAALSLLNDVSSYLSASSSYIQQQKDQGQWRLPIGDTEVSNLTSQMARATSNSHMRTRHSILRQVAAGKAEPDEVVKERHVFACYMAQMERMHDCRPFLTDRGYVGIAAMSAQPGDQIVILLGARVPYTVRNASDETYVLIGESHVYGIMDGEIMQQVYAIEDVQLF